MSVVLRSWPYLEEFWFDEPVREHDVDVAVLCNRSNLPSTVPSHSKFTLLIDLTRCDGELLADMNASTRHHIRRAHKDGFSYSAPTVPDDAVLRQLHDVLTRFARVKGLVPASLPYLRVASSAGVAYVSHVSFQGEPVVWHAHLVVRQRARLLHSASLFRGQDITRRNLIGRANRLLHWQEMRAFRDAGCDVYDFGGWYAGRDDVGLLSINRFKEGFGGRLRREVDGLMALSPIGHAYVHARGLCSRLNRGCAAALQTVLSPTARCSRAAPHKFSS